MLSEEEKEAIEKLKKIREDTIKANECGLSNNDFKEEIEVYDVILNLITKLKKEDEKLREKEQDLLRKLRNRVKEVKKLTKYSLYKKEFSTLNKRIQEKDREIDLMADKLVEAHEWFYSEFDNFTKEDFIEYFETKAKKGE